MSRRFSCIDYRNCRFQGICEQGHLPDGEGVLLDDSMRFVLSRWSQGQIQGPSLVFESHSKYLYGEWRSGVPNGINFYRAGETVLLGHFQAGQITGKFIVVFQLQRLLLVAESREQQSVIVRTMRDATQQDIDAAAKQHGFEEGPFRFDSLVRFLKGFCDSSESGIIFEDRQDQYYLGIPNGLGITFTEDYSVSRVGHIATDMHIVTIGGVYNQSLSKEGDFEGTQTLEYTGQRPVEEIKAVLKEAHLKSLTFKNQYLITSISQVMLGIDKVLSGQLTSQMAQDQLQESRGLNIEEINDSLQRHPVNKQEGERLKKMRAELYLSIGRPGSQIKPVKKDKISQFIAAQEQSDTQFNRFYQKKFDQNKQDTARFEGVTHNRISKSPIRPIVEQSKNSSIITFGKGPQSIKYEDIMEKRTRLLNEYKGIGHGRPSRSPLRPSVDTNHLSKYDSPYHHLGQAPESLHNKGQDSTDTMLRTASRRQQVAGEEIPSRSPTRKFKYLNTLI